MEPRHEIVFFLAFLLMSAPCFAVSSPSIAYLSDGSEHERHLTLSIWYPSDEEVSAKVGGNAVFRGTSTVLNAPLPTDPLPLVVVSHGGLRSAANSGSWLSAYLAQAGFIAVEVNAPRPENAWSAVNEIWRRPQDVSRALDLILHSREWANRIDQNNISVVGFALGGTAALFVAGEEIDVESYFQSCAGDGDTEGPDCAWYAAQGVSLALTDQAGLEQRKHDPRLTSAVAIEPEYLGAFRSTSTDVPTLIVLLGDQVTAPAEDRPNVLIPGATSFDAFAACTEAGPEILLEEDGDASICGASPEAREKSHKNIATAITAFLARESE